MYPGSEVVGVPSGVDNREIHLFRNALIVKRGGCESQAR